MRLVKEPERLASVCNFEVHGCCHLSPDTPGRSGKDLTFWERLLKRRHLKMACFRSVCTAARESDIGSKSIEDQCVVLQIRGFGNRPLNENKKQIRTCTTQHKLLSDNGA